MYAERQKRMSSCPGWKTGKGGDWDAQRPSKEAFEEMRRTHVETENLDHVYPGLRNVSKFHPPAPIAVRCHGDITYEQLLGLRGKRGRIIRPFPRRRL